MQAVPLSTVAELAALRPPVRTAEALLERDVDQLLRNGLSRSVILGARREVAKACLGVDALPYALGFEDEEEWGVSSGSTSVDALLGPVGFPAGWVCEVEGPTATGKTQLCLTVAANAAVSGRSVLWIEAGSCSFSWTRFHNLLRARKGAEEALPTNLVQVYFAPDAISIVRCVETCSDRDVLVVDSPCAVLAPNLGGEKNQIGHRDLALVAHALAKQAKLGPSLVLLVNATVRADDDSGSQLWKPALGLTWTYAASIRLSINADRVATLVKHPHRPAGASYTARFSINAAGITDQAHDTLPLS